MTCDCLWFRLKYLAFERELTLALLLIHLAAKQYPPNKYQTNASRCTYLYKAYILRVGWDTAVTRHL